MSNKTIKKKLKELPCRELLLLPLREKERGLKKIKQRKRDIYLCLILVTGLPLGIKRDKSA